MCKENEQCCILQHVKIAIKQQDVWKDEPMCPLMAMFLPWSLPYELHIYFTINML